MQGRISAGTHAVGGIREQGIENLPVQNVLR